MLMEITGEKVKLKLFTALDWPLFRALYTDATVMKHVYDPLSEEVARAVFESRLEPWAPHCDGWLSLSINDVSTGEQLGIIGLKMTKHQEKIAEIGFMLTGEAQGRGIATNSLSLFIQYAFDELGLNKLVALCSTNNHGSYKLLEKTGFVREGCLLQNSMINNHYVDDYAYGLINSGFRR